jgi:hypothetical protein
MAHFAKVINGIVEDVIVAEQEFIDSGAVGNPENWIQTSYNMYAGVHKLGGIPLRKNFAGKGFFYDKNIDAFIPPQPIQFPSWILNEEKCIWEPPIPMPNDNKHYDWNEDELKWNEIDIDLLIKADNIK